MPRIVPSRRAVAAALRRWLAVAVLVVSGAVIADSDAPIDFTRAGLDGEPVSLSDFRGRWVVVNFWATWCGPCIREIPVLDALHRARDDVVVVGVNFETIALDQLREFSRDIGISYPVVQVGQEPLLPFEPLKGLPSTFVVSPDANLAAVRVGEVDRAWLERHTGAAE